MYGQIVQDVGTVDPACEVEIIRVSVVQFSQNQKPAVRSLDHPRDIFGKNARQVVSLPERIFISIIVLLLGEESGATPYDGKHRHAEIGRGLRKGAKPRK